MEKIVKYQFFDELHSEATLCLKRLEWLLNQIEDSGDNTMIWDVGCAVIRDADNQFNEIWDKNRKASNL